MWIHVKLQLKNKISGGTGMGLIRCKMVIYLVKKHGNICPYCNVTVNKMVVMRKTRRENIVILYI